MCKALVGASAVRVGLLLVLFMLGLPVFAQPEMAPPNPAFARYLEDVRLGKSWPIVTPEGYWLGYVPEPVDLSHIAGIRVSDRDGFPTSYDLRTLGRVTPVRSQGACGSCWAFATYGALESWLLTAGRGSWDLSENNLKECHGFTWGPCEGGNAYMSAAYLSRRSGPLNEADDPYVDNPTGCFPYGRWPGVPVRLYLRKGLVIPPRTGPLDNDNLKWAIMNYGAVMVSMRWESSCYDPSNYTYYYSGTGVTNHAVDLVGWDDNKTVTGAPGVGAWIVRNSWGPDFGEGGYFYISYYDSKVATTANTVFVDVQNPDQSMVYHYDYLGWIANWGYGSDTAWAANVFTTTEPGTLTAVATYASTVNTSYELYIKQGGPNGTVLHSQSGALSLPGYYTIDLTTPVNLGAGVTFSVVIKFTTPNYNYPIPAECVWPGYSDDAVIGSGESYISSNGTSWTDMSTLSNPSNACIKAIVARSAKQWTVAVYLAADNDLGGGTPSDPDFRDFDEMEKALTTSGAAVNVVVLWDKPGTNDTAIYWVQPDDVEGTLATYTLNVNKWYIPSGWEFDYSNGWPKGAPSPSEENMGTQATLTNFLNFVFYNFQSDYYALILWNHGGGWEPKSKEPPTHVSFLLENGEPWEHTFWPPTQPHDKKEPLDRARKPDPVTRGVCWDYTNGDYLTIKEVANGIANSSRHSVHTVGFDACLMQMLEVAYEVRNVAQYMTASQETEWGWGWAYHQIIAGITSTTTPLQLAQLWGTTRARWVQGGLDTISSVDLSKVGPLAAHVNDLGNRLSALLGTNARYQEIMYAKLLSLCFAYNEFLDLDDFCHWINAFVDDATAKSLAQTVRNDIASAVVAKANASDYASAGGISIYMPHRQDIQWGAPHGNYNASNFAFCADYAWDEFLNAWLATDYPDPYESNNTPATAFNLGVNAPGLLVLHWEADFDDSTPDWYKFTVFASPFNLWVYAWCTEYYSNTVIYLYSSQANAEAGNYLARDDDGLHVELGRNQFGSYLYLTDLPAGTYYLKVIPYGESYGVDEDYELWVGVMRASTAATFRVERGTGDVLADGAFYGQKFESGSADIAEWVPVSEPVELGDVLELDPTRPGFYRKARGPCSTLVAGVVSTQPGVVLGQSEDRQGKALLALIGIVPVKVTDEGGPIRPGDLLVASSTPGYAMRWDPENGAPCAFVGKALEPHKGGSGVILVLLMR